MVLDEDIAEKKTIHVAHILKQFHYCIKVKIKMQES